MIEHLTDDDVTTALADLVGCLGVKEDRPLRDLVTRLREGNTRGCVQEIANQLGLPVRIDLSYVSQGRSHAGIERRDANGFRSTHLARVDRNGRALEGITAQVEIPQDLPLFGTSSLQEYRIEVRVSKDCRAQPYTFIAVIAHELSHVLLSSLWSPHRKSELHTDLVPILLGFRNAVRKGRKVVENWATGDTVLAQTTTYGYLTDTQFELACNYVDALVQQYAQDKRRLVQAVERTRRGAREASRRLAMFRAYLKHLDQHPPRRMRQEHAERVVQLHGQHHAQEWELRIKAVDSGIIDSARSFADSLSHYSSSAMEQLEGHARRLEQASHAIREVAETITQDLQVLQKYVGITFRLQTALLQAWQDLVRN